MARKFRILSLSGGGVRGVFQATYLDRLSQVFERKDGSRLEADPARWFDFVAGTSTGAIVALAIAFKIDLKRIVELYESRIPHVFGSRCILRLLRKGALYDSASLREALLGVFANAQLGQAKVPIMIAATKLDRFSHKIFFSADSDDAQLSVVDVALASCAAPFAFPPVKPTGSLCTYSDGGLWANSPTLAAIAVAQEKYAISTALLRILLVGNGYVPFINDPARFLKPTEMLSSLLDISFSAQERAVEDLAQRIVGKEQIVIVNAPLQRQVKLDDTSGVGQLRALVTDPEIESTLPKAHSLLVQEEIIRTDETAHFQSQIENLNRRGSGFERWQATACRNAKQIRERQFARKEQPLSDVIEGGVIYKISKNFDTEVFRWQRLRAVRDRINHIHVAVSVEEDAHAVDFVEDLELELPEDFTYLVMKNGGRSKELLVFPLPEILVPNETHLTMRYRWPGMFRKLGRGTEDLEYEIRSVSLMKTFRIEVYVEPEMAKVPRLLPQGSLLKKGTVTDSICPDAGRWPGKTYSGSDIEPDFLRLELGLVNI